jgi:hypothetical protein
LPAHVFDRLATAEHDVRRGRVIVCPALLLNLDEAFLDQALQNRPEISGTNSADLRELSTAHRSMVETGPI